MDIEPRSRRLSVMLDNPSGSCWDVGFGLGNIGRSQCLKDLQCLVLDMM